MTDINTGHAVYVLGDADTSQHMDMLTAKAAEHGAVIGQTFAFGPGEASDTEDLSEVDAVVEAVGQAIATRTDVWLPFWLQDLCREQHLRSVSITLQRHGLNLLLGPNLTPCPADGGLNALDAAVRNEIRLTYALEDAAMAAAGMRSLGAEIEAALARQPQSGPTAHPPIGDEPREPNFSTAEAAAILGKSPDWVSRGVRQQTFVYPDGSAVQPRHHHGNRRTYTVPMLRAIAWSAYRRGTLTPQRLEEVLAALTRSEG